MAASVQDGLVKSRCKVEYTFECVQQLVVDMMHNGVLPVPAPILNNSFLELGQTMLLYHEAKKLSHVPFPLAYRQITLLILLAEALFVPFMLAMLTKGVASSFGYTFVATFLLWFLNGVADSLDNPFRKMSSALNTAAVQSRLNDQLEDLKQHAWAPTPSLNRNAYGRVTVNSQERSKSLS